VPVACVRRKDARCRSAGGRRVWIRSSAAVVKPQVMFCPPHAHRVPCRTASAAVVLQTATRKVSAMKRRRFVAGTLQRRRRWQRGTATVVMRFAGSQQRRATSVTPAACRRRAEPAATHALPTPPERDIELQPLAVEQIAAQRVEASAAGSMAKYGVQVAVRAEQRR